MVAQPTHDAILGESVIYFIFSFNATGALDIHQAADRLLKSGVAETVVSPRDGEVRVAHRYRQLVSLMSQSNRLQEVSSAIEENRLFRWMVRHPIQAVRLLKHSASVRSQSSQEEGESPSPAASLPETISFIARSVAESQMANAIQYHIERDLLKQSYLASEPYLRLRLRGAGQWLRRMNGGAVRPPGNLDEGIGADILLLIHRSGVMQLTVALKLPDDITVDQYLEMCFGSSGIANSSRLAEPVLRGAYGKRSERHWLGEWEPDREEGVRWRFAQHHDSPAAVSDLFNLYRDAIMNTIRCQSPGDWFCYPVAFIEKIACCDSEASFRSVHETELKNAIARSVDVSEVRPEALAGIIPQDASLTEDTSFYCNMSSSLEVRWPGTGEGEFAQHLHRLVILESALLQYWQIRSLDRRVGVTSGRLKHVREIQREAIFGLREYRDSSISFGSALDLVERLLGEWRTDRLYGHVLESIDQLQQLVAAAESERSARRANVLAGMALIVAVFLGLPAIDDTLGIANKVKVGGFAGMLAKPFHALAARGENGTWIGYLLFLAAVLLCLLTLVSKQRRPRLRRRRRGAGISWPLGTVTIVQRDDGQDG
ncbi:hypothetical protein [Streptomyces sp. NPDC027717]|uniref:hypothetical protein n=1 Tax=Streptomyces sp. NPDC027717 TaxID=3155765 RepID=UPI0033CB08A9